MKKQSPKEPKNILRPEASQDEWEALLADEDYTDPPESPEDPVLSYREEFLRKYEASLNPGPEISLFRRQCNLDDLYTLLCKLHAPWIREKAWIYANTHFPGVDESISADMALSIGCEQAYLRLLDDISRGHRVEYPLSYYLRIARNKSIDDYFRKKYGRMARQKPGDEDGREDHAASAKSHNPKDPVFVRIEAMQTSPDGTYRNQQIKDFRYEPFRKLLRESPNRQACIKRMLQVCLEEMMNYPGEPQKILALMYGKIIFQTVKSYGDSSPIAMQAKSSTKVSSPDWAHARMGREDLQQLGKTAQAVLVRYYDRSLCWGPIFIRYMGQIHNAATDLTWGRVVYTETYTKSQTSNWIESISKSTVQKACRRLASDRLVMEYVTEDLDARDKIRKAMKKVAKEAVR